MVLFQSKILAINSSWTSLEKSHPWKHFRISGHRKLGQEREVEMMAVCDRKTRIWIPIEDLKSQMVWIPGWK